ncbi:MAG: hypothetical protein E6R04_00990 [Spirochaetes bacterium]|nr:MAG: hypothetical protein E6R04_00990 [Spirochaetota bacterium]
MSDESVSKVAEMWGKMEEHLALLQKDLQKNTVKHNVSAGVRLRAGLREVRTQISAIIKETLEADKAVTEARAAKKGAGAEAAPAEAPVEG